MSVVLSPELKYITEELLQEWKNPNPSGSSRVSDPVPMTRFLYELCWAMVCGELPFQNCKTALDSVQFEEDHFGDEMGSILADTLADIVAQFAQDLTISGDYRARLVKMTKVLVQASLVPARLLQERCEEEFLFEAELSRLKAQDLKSREVRVNTRLLYQQTKFNLLREESEGYAKLVTLLCQGCLDSTNSNSLVVTISIIKSLIGHFDLDPNRVFDIVLDCFEQYPEKKIFYDLIPIFPKSHAAQILGFKFQYYQRMEITTPVPSSLFHLAALLVKENFVDLDSIYPHLLPQDEDAFMHYEGFLSKKLDEANKIGRINLAATGKDLMETEEKQDVSVDFYAVCDLEMDVLAERAPEVGTNQKLGLLIGFLSVHDWYHAQILFERLSPMNPVEHVEICNGLFMVIEETMSTAYGIVSTSYQEASGKSGISDDLMEEDYPATSSSSIDLPREFFQMLSVIGPYLHRDTALLQKVCRVLRGYHASMRDNAAKPNSPVSDELRRYKEARARIEDAIGSCLLPSLQLLPANPAIGYEIWDVLSLLPYEVRYRLYGEWEKDDERNPLILSARQLAKLDTRRILKRLAKENLKQLGRMVAKLAHGNPMTVLRTIVQQIEAYRDMITPVVDAFKYLTQLEYDILEYVVIERLAQGGRDKLKEDGLNLSDWLQSLASFWGSLCKKYPSMELRGLFQYLINQLKKGSGSELVLLEELIEQMANVHYTENITEEQLDALAGSETLRFQSTLYGGTRNNKVLSKSTNRLRDSLLPKDDPKLAIPLLMLIAQYHSMVIIKADAPYIKMVSEQFDRCHGTLLQYVDFLSSAISPVTAYAQFIPSLHDLAHKYHLEPEVAFLIYRPVMRLFKGPGSEGVCWPLDAGEVCSEKGLSDFVLHLDFSQGPVRWSELLTTVESMVPSKSWKSLSPDLYATFWGLTLYDLYVPKKRYEDEIAKQHSALKALEELSDTSSFAISKRKKDKEKIQELLDRLVSEYQKHKKHMESVRQRMAREKDRWLSQCPEPGKTNMELLQRCVFPRSIFSATDAAYCAAFVRLLHALGTPFFSTFQYIELLFCKLLQPMICCCTELEAGRFGRFLCETLRMVYDWKKDESLYERECANMPGFALNYRDPNGQRVSFAQFVRVNFKWSQKITRVLVQCLESTEYMEIRNALIVLTKISAVFPVLRKSGVNIEKRVAKIKADEREDLKVLATGVAAALASRKSTWLSDEEFGMGHMESKPAASPAKAPPGNNNRAVDSGDNPPKEHTTRLKSTADAKNERSNGAASRLPDEHAKAQSEETKVSRPSAESEIRAQQKQRGASSILGKPPKLESGKILESRPDPTPTTTANGKASQRGTIMSNASTHVAKVESGTVQRTSHDHTQKRAVQIDEQDRDMKRRKGEERERETENEKERERENDRSSRDRADDRHEKEQREREKQRERERERERSMERRERDRSLDRGGKDVREREKLPPPPPLPASFVPQSVSRHSVERERERDREDDVNKKRREEDNRDGRKREDRDSSSSKIEEKEREKLKEESEANAKRRKVKRSSSTEPGEYSPAVPSSHSYDTRGDRKGAGTPHRGSHGDDNARTHSKDTSSRANRRDTEQSHERDWEEDKRQRADTKRKHRK